MDCDKSHVGYSQHLVSTIEEMNTKEISIMLQKNHNVITKHILSNPDNKHNIDLQKIEVLHTKNNWKKEQ